MRQRITIHIDGSQHTLAFEQPMLISEAICTCESRFALPCAGTHSCGKCKVVAYGALSAPTEEERKLLTTSERLGNTRLACCAVITGGCTIYAALPAGMQSILHTEAAPRIDSSPFGTQGYAFAVDIGTTTVAVYLLKLEDTSRPLAIGALNAQARFGADVISRIQSCLDNGTNHLQQAITQQLNMLFINLLTENGVPARAVKGVTVSGNTTMLHLLAGLDPTGIASAPFTPQSLFGVMYDARRLFASLPPTTPVYLTPCISGYLGGDLVCALLSCPLSVGDLLLDIGTNGEMALMTEEVLLCCSTAAGPAFEGVGLSQGMIASDGAISHVSVANNALSYHTVGDKKPCGICGTGAISALAAMRALGELDETGLLDEHWEGAFPIGESGVSLTQQDIRQLQLAKAAIAAGIDTLLHHGGLSPVQLGTIYLAGGFGSRLDIKSAVDIGLIPPISGTVIDAGNAAGAGACLCATAQSAIDDAEKLAAGAREIPLSTDSYFSTRYIEQMLFPPQA